MVALVKDLRGVFGPEVDCWLVDNGANAHDVRPYLTAVETGRAIVEGPGWYAAGQALPGAAN